jgi:hypothetical protein
MTKAGVEHQSSGWRRVQGEYAKHRPLIVVPEMEEAVPSQYSIKPPTESQGPHVSDDPLLIRHPGSTERDQRRMTVGLGGVGFTQHTIELFQQRLDVAVEGP